MTTQRKFEECEMLLTDFFQQLASKADADRRAVEAEWRTVVTKVATDTATEAAVIDVLRATGRTLQELQVAVQREQRITELRGIVATKADALQELERATQAAADFNRDRQIEFKRNREDALRVHGETHMARTNFDNIAAAQRELDDLMGTTQIERPEPLTAYQSTLSPKPIERPEIVASNDIADGLSDLLGDSPDNFDLAIR